MLEGSVCLLDYRLSSHCCWALKLFLSHQTHKSQANPNFTSDDLISWNLWESHNPLKRKRQTPRFHSYSHSSIIRTGKRVEDTKRKEGKDMFDDFIFRIIFCPKKTDNQKLYSIFNS